MAVINIISKVNLDGEKRLDAEYYQPHYFDILESFHKISDCNLGQVANSVKEIFRKNVETFEYIEITNIDLETGLYDSHLIPSENMPTRAKYVVKESNVIISKVRPHRNAVAYIENSDNIQVCSSGFCVLNAESISKEFLFVFLKTKFVKDLLNRDTTATMYPAVSEPDILNLPIFIPNEILDSFVTNNFRESRKLLRESEQLYDKAERILSNKTLADMKFKSSLIFESRVSDCTRNNRIDAEYHQPKYNQFFENLKQIATGQNWELKKIKELSEPLRYGTSEKLAYLDEGVPFLRITDLKNFGFEKASLVYISEEEAEQLSYASVKKGDLLISRSGTLGVVAPIDEELTNSIFGSYFIRIRPKIEISQEYLALYLNSFLGRLQVERTSTGAVQTNLTIPAIEDIQVLIPDKGLQEELTTLLSKSRKSREDGKLKLVNAKLKIEEFVEKGYLGN